MTRLQLRQNSIIHWLQCARCKDPVVAKVSRGDGSLSDACAQSRHEYETLCKLQRVFPQDARYGTLVPLGYLEFSRRGIMITRHFRGDDLANQVRLIDTPGALEACHAAGCWLRKLHESSDLGAQKRMLDVGDKLDYLASTYGRVLRGDRKAWAAYRCLEQAASRIDTRVLGIARLHGDFKPQNMLCDGTRYVGLDIHWQSTGSPVYDLAPFLNHLWLGGSMLHTPRAWRRHQLAEKEFLTGYGNDGDTQVLRWAQLYFALCHLGAYRQHGRLAASYMNWKLMPFALKLVTRLEAVC